MSQMTLCYSPAFDVSVEAEVIERDGKPCLVVRVHNAHRGESLFFYDAETEARMRVPEKIMPAPLGKPADAKVLDIGAELAKLKSEIGKG